MNSEFFSALEALEKEKGIPKEYMLEKVEAALVSAYKKDQGGNSNVKIVLDPEKKIVKVFQQKEIVEVVENDALQITLEDAKKISKRSVIGGIADIELKTKNFRRLSAQAAKQVIIQGIREAERDMMIREYENKREEIVSAVVEKIDPLTGDVVVDTGTSKAVLLKSNQIPGESFTEGDFEGAVSRCRRGKSVRRHYAQRRLLRTGQVLAGGRRCQYTNRSLCP